MLSIYKVGLGVYNGREDTNSGLFEYNMIKGELKKWHIKGGTKKDVLFVVGGYLRDEEKDTLESLLEEKFDVKIFIATDYVAITTCLEYINKFDYLLTQAMNPIEVDSIKIEQFYNGIPELFYKHTKKSIRVANQKSKIIFGGADTGREDLFKKYNFGDKETYDLFIKKNETLEDNRIRYSDFIIELSEHKFTIVFGRKVYREIGWVTARYYESIANFCLPFVDSSFYSGDNLRLSECIFDDFIVVNSYEELLFKRSLLMSKDNIFDALIAQLRDVAERNEDTFIKLVEQLVG